MMTRLRTCILNDGLAEIRWHIYITINKITIISFELDDCS
jgi:hypothetical protein